MAKQKILIAEDEISHLNVMKTKLEWEGYEVIALTEGDKVIQAIKDQKPDLILLDIILPNADGFEILSKLQDEKSEVPVIIVSNSGQPVEIDRALKLGARDYLVKAEFNPADVLDKVRKVLGESESR